METTDFSVATPRGPVAGSEIGNGPPVALVPGLGSTRRIWGELPHALARDFRVITLDNRGVGGSRDGHPFSLQGAACDLIAVLDDRGVGRAAIVGASLGGVIALAAALQFPNRVGALVIASSSAHLSRHGRKSLQLLRDLLDHLPPHRIGSSLMALAFAPPFHERFGGFVDEAADLYGIDPDDLPGATAQADHLLGGWDLRGRLAKLDTPTLVIAGARDPVVAVEDTAELAAVLPRARLVRLADAAHSVLAEGGGDVLDEMTAFLLSSGL
jgi:pimeloyl-ACP methyl ester carboxylesterase